MQEGQLRALLIEESPGDALLWIDVLQSAGFVVRPDVCRTSADVERLIRTADYDIILADYALSDWIGIEAIEIARRLGKHIPTIVVTGQLGDEKAVDCIRWGAADYVVKDRLSRLPMVVRRAIDDGVVRRQSQLLSAALLNVGEGILIAEAKPDLSSAHIVSLNSAFERITGYGSGDLLGKPLASLQTPEVGSDFFRECKERLRDLDCVTAEFTHSRKDGTVYDAEWRISPLRDEFRGISHYIVILRDVTDRKRIAAELANSNKELAKYSAELREAKCRAEAENKAKSDFLTAISHDIRTPLNVIIGMADLLSDGGLTQEQSRYVEVFQRAGEGLLVLIDQLLDLAKIESGQVELESRAFDLNAVLEDTNALFEAPARNKGLNLSFRISPGTPTGLVGDPNKLQQVLTNLVGNALKFTETGSIEVKVSLHKTESPSECSIQFEVVDTGIGLPADKVSVIFEAFAQAESSTSRLYGGTGLGLSICRALVERMHGTISVESQVGVGSTFRFRSSFGLQQNAVKAPPQQEPMQVLLCEDSQDNAFVIAAYLEKGNYALDHAPDGKVGVEKFKSKRFDVVLMDLQMPILDGHSAVRAIRAWEASEGREATPIFALTAHAQHGEAERCRDSGCTAFLSKPIRKATLLAALAEQLPNSDRIQDHFVLPSEIKELVPGYLHRSRLDLARLWAAVEAAEYSVISTFGHQLRGSGAAYGFDKFSEIGAAMERAAKRCNLEDIRYHVGRFEEALNEAIAEQAPRVTQSDRKAICC